MSVAGGFTYVEHIEVTSLFPCANPNHSPNPNPNPNPNPDPNPKPNPNAKPNPDSNLIEIHGTKGCPTVRRQLH